MRFEFDTDYASEKSNWLFSLNYIDVAQTVDVDSERSSLVPEEFQLDQNYPNPFNPTTRIQYQLAEDSQVSLTIYDIAGKLITTLINEALQPAGYYDIQWNGEDRSGNQVSTGVYLCRLNAGTYNKTMKMVLLH
jgi:hypothetical protein